MKRKSTELLVLIPALTALLSGLTACNATPGAGAHDPMQDPWGMYEQAMDQLRTADSWSMDADTEVTIREGENEVLVRLTDATVNQAAAGTESPEIEMMLNVSNDVMGVVQQMETTGWLRDNISYEETDGIRIRRPATAEELLRLAHVHVFQFDETMILNQSATGGLLTFSLDGEAVRQELLSQMGDFGANLPGTADVAFRDVEVSALLREDGTPENIRATAAADLVEGDRNMTMDYAHTLVINDLGNTTVTFPADLERW